LNDIKIPANQKRFQLIPDKLTLLPMLLTQKSLEVLHQLDHLVSSLPDGAYNQPIEILEGNTIGKHSRHIIEFFECLMSSAAQGVVDYDIRSRDLRLETIPAELSMRIKELSKTLSEAEFIHNNDIMLRTRPVAESDSVMINTSFDRELWYNVEHCIHHLAIIKIAARFMGVKDIPADVGLAFSTKQYLQDQ
jgi:uncharacterized damage-inducible protein DinB